MVGKQIATPEPEWCAQLKKFLDNTPRGYQAEMCRVTGCSPGELTRIKAGDVEASSYVEAIAKYVGMPLPHPTLNDAASELLTMYEKLGEAEKKALETMAKNLADIAMSKK